MGNHEADEVKCPKCGAPISIPFLIDGCVIHLHSNVAEAGSIIACPKCGHTFGVSRDKTEMKRNGSISRVAIIALFAIGVFALLAIGMFK